MDNRYAEKRRAIEKVFSRYSRLEGEDKEYGQAQTQPSTARINEGLNNRPSPSFCNGSVFAVPPLTLTVNCAGPPQSICFRASLILRLSFLILSSRFDRNKVSITVLPSCNYFALKFLVRTVACARKSFRYDSGNRKFPLILPKQQV